RRAGPPVAVPAGAAGGGVPPGARRAAPPGAAAGRAGRRHQLGGVGPVAHRAGPVADPGRRCRGPHGRGPAGSRSPNAALISVWLGGRVDAIVRLTAAFLILSAVFTVLERRGRGRRRRPARSGVRTDVAWWFFVGTVGRWLTQVGIVVVVVLAAVPFARP